MQLPPFLDLVGNSLVFNQENKEFVFAVPEVFFNSGTTKNPIAEINGAYVSMIGLCNWYIVDSNGKKSESKLFNFPTMFLCKPYKIEKVKGINIMDSDDESQNNDYRLLHFKKGDEVVHHIRVPQLVDNVELFYKLFVITGKIPTSIPYDKLWELFIESANLNGINYGINYQLFGVVTAALCRDPKDISRPFRMTKMNNMNQYKPLSIKLVPNYISPFTAIGSEGFDESLRSAIMMKDRSEEDIPYSPLEKNLMR